jgi:hypothetical protein
MVRSVMHSIVSRSTVMEEITESRIRLHELFTRPLPYHRLSLERYGFAAGGKEFEVDFIPVDQSSTEVVLKRVDGSRYDPYSTQGDFGGSPISVYATVFSIIGEYVGSEQPDHLYFYGADDRQVQLYAKMIPWIKSFLPNSYEVSTHSDDPEFGPHFINIHKTWYRPDTSTS